MRTSEETKPLVKDAVTILQKYLTNKMAGNEQVKIALSTLQLHAKLISAESNQDMVALAAIKMMQDKNEAKFIDKNLPHLLPEK